MAPSPSSNTTRSSTSTSTSTDTDGSGAPRRGRGKSISNNNSLSLRHLSPVPFSAASDPHERKTRHELEKKYGGFSWKQTLVIGLVATKIGCDMTKTLHERRKEKEEAEKGEMLAQKRERRAKREADAARAFAAREANQLDKERAYRRGREYSQDGPDPRYARSRPPRPRSEMIPRPYPDEYNDGRGEHARGVDDGYYPDSRYMEGRPRDGGYRDDRYYDDRYYDDRYDDDRYHDDRYHDDRYHDDQYHDDRYARRAVH